MSLAVLESPGFGEAELPDDRYAAADELARQLQHLEQDIRFCEAKIATVLDQADRLGVYSIDGHRNIRSWAAANVNWSRRESLERARTVTLLRDLPELAEDLKYGEVGVAQVRELARVRANPRCGEQITEAADELVALAKAVPFEEFRTVTQRWEQLNDTDGAHRGHEAAHAGRRVSTSMFDDTFHLAAQFGAVQGAAIARDPETVRERRVRRRMGRPQSHPRRRRVHDDDGTHPQPASRRRPVRDLHGRRRHTTRRPSTRAGGQHHHR